MNYSVLNWKFQPDMNKEWLLKKWTKLLGFTISNKSLRPKFRISAPAGERYHPLASREKLLLSKNALLIFSYIEIGKQIDFTIFMRKYLLKSRLCTVQWITSVHSGLSVFQGMLSGYLVWREFEVKIWDLLNIRFIPFIFPLVRLS